MEKFKLLKKEQISKLPKTSGVYAFLARRLAHLGGGGEKDREFFYIGKAANIRQRVKNHFQLAYRDNFFENQVQRIGYLKTDSEIEALILEAKLIKKYQPKYNVVWRDDKNYFYLAITKEDFPKIFITHQPPHHNRDKSSKAPKLTKSVPVWCGGPFVDGKSLKTTLKILRRIFPFRSCGILPKRPCLWYQLKRCPAPCLTKTKLGEQIPEFSQKMKKECQKNAKNLIKILKGNKKTVLCGLEKEMKALAEKEEFEMAAEIKKQIQALKKVFSHAQIFNWQIQENLPIQTSSDFLWKKTEKELKKILKTKTSFSRIEAYDVSNIQGKQAAGSMVTFILGKPDKNFYRKFKIRISEKPNDLAMIREILSRRFNHQEWPLPNLILIDGGLSQLSTAVKTKKKKQRTKNISVAAIAKRKNELYVENRKKPLLLKTLPREIFNLILQLRDEAHRFALVYHKKLRKIDLLSQS